MIDEFTNKGSGWVIIGWKRISVQLSNYKPIKGSSYLPLPKYFANKKAIINIKNTDNKCFAYSVAAHLHPVNVHPERPQHYAHAVDNFLGITHPMPCMYVKEHI